MKVLSPLAIVFMIAVTIEPTQLFAQPRPDRGFPDRGRGGGELIDPGSLTFDLGVATIPNRETFERLSYQGPMRGDAYLSDLEFVKFIIANTETDQPIVYWMNTENFQAHPSFSRAAGVGRGRGEMRGAVTYLPRLRTPDGSTGLYIFDFQPNSRYSFEEVEVARDALIETAPLLEGKLAFHPLHGNIELYEREKEKYASANLPVHLDDDLFGNIGYLPLNEAESYGRLTVLEGEFRPSPRDIVICRTLPNQMPRVAGVITAVRQTPLSHVNLRAVQDNVPNAFVIDAMENQHIASLIGKPVHYMVTAQGYSLREATQDEVDAHFGNLRPSESQEPVRDLSRTTIQPLTQITFEDSISFGVKTANLAAMHQFALPERTLPDGVGIPFYFYDEFMKHNGFYERVDALLSSSEFRSDREKRERELETLRELIEDGEMPDWMMDALSQAQESFPEGTSIRCRSSTNNEDLPGFSGAGLYDSFTHKPDEGHLSKSIKQVYASLWNLRAVEEREFYRVDHRLTAMGVLLHPNFKDEQANGVAVTDDVLYEEQGFYYINAQVGEDLVTNPDEQSIPEEILLGWWERDGYRVVVESNRVADGSRVLSHDQLAELRSHLARIHARFASLYGRSVDDERFAMEIEFKVDNQSQLVIKQARPWIFAQTN